MTKTLLQLHFKSFKRKLSTKLCPFPCYFQVHHLPYSPKEKAENKGTWLARPDFQILPLLHDNKRGGSSAQRQVKPPSEVCCVVEGILCFVKSWKSAEMKAEFRGSSTRLLHKARGTLPVPGCFDLGAIIAWWTNRRTHLHVNTGSRCWKWAPAQQRSWTCSATGGRCRTARGLAPSCWTNPTPSYVLSEHPRCSFCDGKTPQINQRRATEESKVRRACQTSRQQRNSYMLQARRQSYLTIKKVLLET